MISDRVLAGIFAAAALALLPLWQPLVWAALGICW